MRILCGRLSSSRGERGGARLNFLIVMAIIAVLGYLGYQSFPVFYQARNFQSFMQETVDTAAITDKKPAWVEQQLKTALPDYDVPPEAIVKASITRGRVEAQVQFTRTIPMIVTQYQYDFDKTVRSASSATGG
jgi:Tfp pilus assembly protein PilE